jgi:dipeptidyl aminopeptidase/acylaminoacyl peptidase
MPSPNPPRTRSLTLARTLGCLLLAATPQLAASIPVDDFFRKPLVAAPSLSPDGRNLAYALRDEKDPDGDDYGVSLLNLQTMEPHALKLSGRSTQPMRWMDNERLILFGDRQGHSVYDLKRKKPLAFNQSEWFRVLSAPKAHPGLLNVYFFPGDQTLRSGPARINPAQPAPQFSGSINERYNVKSWIDLPPGEAGSFQVDWQGRLRLATLYHNQQLRYHYRADETSPWQMLDLDVYDEPILAFHPDPDKLYVVSRQGDEPAAGIHLYNVATRTFVERVFHEPDFSMTEATAYVSPQDGSLLGFSYQKDTPAVHWLDATLQQVQAAINAKLPGRANLITDYDDKLETFLIASTADRSPPAYYLHHRTKGSFAGLPDPYPTLRKAALRPTQVIRYRTRDGVRLQGYLTLPSPRPDGAKPPLVVLAHGGPWVRDIWGFDREVQFLASRGYAVFQPNYRGSSGFTREISDDKKYDFQATHDDVTDGVNALKKSGQIDPQRIAIMGASYGGYLAVCGAAFEPDLYKCAISIVGVFDWAKRIKDRTGWRFNRSSEGFFLQRLGDPDAAAAKFDAISPINFAHQIKIPIYLSHGLSDRNVDASQSKKLLAALKENNVPTEVFFPEKEGHGYFETKSRLRLYREIETFLAKYL